MRAKRVAAQAATTRRSVGISLGECPRVVATACAAAYLRESVPPAEPGATLYDAPSRVGRPQWVVPRPRILPSWTRAICSQSAGGAGRSVITSLLLQFGEHQLGHGFQGVE